MLALAEQSLKFSVNMLVACILYYYARPGCLINCCKLIMLFLITQTERSSVLIYKLKMYLPLMFRYILYIVEQAASPTIPRKWSLRENRSYHISTNKQRFCEQNNCCLLSHCVILLGTNTIRSLSRNEI